MRVAIYSHQAFHIGTDAFFSLLSKEQVRKIASLSPDARLAARMEELAKKSRGGKLSDAERGEYEAYLAANWVLATAKAEAQFRLDEDIA